jgi:O-antigen/teichoic acid export membrane protein
LVGFSTFVIAVRHLSDRDDSLYWAWPWKELRNGWPLFISQMMATLYSASGAIIVGFVVGPQDAGAYSVIERVANATVGACLLIHTAAYPKLARLFHVDRHAYWRLLKLVVVIYLFMASVVAVGTILIWDQVLHWLLGQSSTAYELLIVGALVWVLIGIFGPAVTGYLTISGYGDRVLPLTCCVLIASFLLGVPGVLFFGVWAWMACLCLTQIIFIYYFFMLIKDSSGVGLS